MAATFIPSHLPAAGIRRWKFASAKLCSVKFCTKPRVIYFRGELQTWEFGVWRCHDSDCDVVALASRGNL